MGIPASVGGIYLHFPDSLHGWFFASYGNDQHIFTSSDAGQIWTERPTPPHQFLWQVKALDSLRSWIIGDFFGPTVWKTTDGGQNWITEYDGPGDFLLDFDMADTAHGVAVGSSGTVLIYAPAVLGDLDGDGAPTATDVVLELNKVFLDDPFAAPPEAGDLNCDTVFDSEDVVLLLNGTFLGVPFPCNL